VFIYEPNGGQKPLPVPVLQCLYDLTAAEARLVNALFGGRSLTESARACGVSINTAKSVLRRIFTKCAVRRQTELLLLLSLGPRTL
jgi:DNA-binding CsgD family transcriptional regulator